MIYVYVGFSSFNNKKNKILKLEIKNKTYEILLWYKFFGTDQWRNLRFGDLQCEYSNCKVTPDRNKLNESDAILFNWFDINKNDQPLYKLSNQKWIL